MTGAGVAVAVGDGVGVTVSVGRGDGVGVGRRAVPLRVAARGEAVGDAPGSALVAMSSGNRAVGRSVPTTAGTRKPIASRTTATTACARSRSAVRMAPHAKLRERETGGKIGHGGGECDADARRGGGADGGADRARFGSALLKGMSATACTTDARIANDGCPVL